MLRKPAPDAQRRESPLSLMEGERDEDRKTGTGGGEAGPGGSLLWSRRCCPRSTGRLRSRPAGRGSPRP